MNSYQILGIFGVCSIVSGLLIAALTALGGSILAALGAVYMATIWMMLGMQRRARETSDLDSFGTAARSGKRTGSRQSPATRNPNAAH